MGIPRLRCRYPFNLAVSHSWVPHLLGDVWLQHVGINSLAFTSLPVSLMIFWDGVSWVLDLTTGSIENLWLNQEHINESYIILLPLRAGTTLTASADTQTSPRRAPPLLLHNDFSWSNMSLPLTFLFHHLSNITFRNNNLNTLVNVEMV